MVANPIDFCQHEMFVAFSCKQRCTCPSCHQKRTLLTSLHVAEDLCLPVAHRQVVLTIPKRLRVHTRFDRGLLGKLSSCAWTCLQAEVRRMLGRDDVVPGMIGAIQTHGALLHWHPHLHVLIPCGAWTAEGEFLELPEFDLERLQVAWQDAVFEWYLAEEKIEPEVVENMRSWPHSGFSVDQSVFLPAGDAAGIERLIQYVTRCPFSLSRLVKVSDTGQVIYQSEKQACRAFPDPKGDGMQAGVPRNFQILEPLDFLAEFTQYIPPKGSHLIRYYGWYSNKSRGLRKKAVVVASAEAPAELPAAQAASQRSSQAWAMLIQRVYEVDPLCCPECGGQMKVVSFIEPPQTDVIEAILKHCGLWESRSPRGPPDVHELVLELDATYSGHSFDAPTEADESHELTYVEIDTFLASF